MDSTEHVSQTVPDIGPAHTINVVSEVWCGRLGTWREFRGICSVRANAGDHSTHKNSSEQKRR